MELGTKVKHKRYGFEGVVVENQEVFLGCVKVFITKGEHPSGLNTGTYIAYVTNLEIIKAVNVDSNVNNEDVYAVEMELEDGSFIRFAKYNQFIKFMKEMGLKK